METFPFATAPDWGLSDDVTASIEEQALGDGYVLRRPKGINYLRSSWSPSWSFLEKQESQDIYLWLKSRLGLTAFLWLHPDTLELTQVICKTVSRVTADVDLYSVKATFEQDFNL